MPKSDLPEQPVEIPDEETPKADLPQAPVDIPDEDTPKADVPKTGDNALVILYVCMMVAAIAGLYAVRVARRVRQ